ncbi:hypothetical protein D3C79_730360 [compost metagenome]
MHLAAELGQHALGHQLVHRVVLHQQNARPAVGGGECGDGQRVFGSLALQGAAQCLIQGIACQGAGQLMQRGQLRCLFWRQEIAVGRHQQDRCCQRRAQLEQVVQVVGDQQVDGTARQCLGTVMP